MLFGRLFMGVQFNYRKQEIIKIQYSIQQLNQNQLYQSENLIISQYLIITACFKGHQLSTATLNSYFSPMIYDYTGSITNPLFTSVFACIFSLICVILLLLFKYLNIFQIIQVSHYLFYLNFKKQSTKFRQSTVNQENQYYNKKYKKNLLSLVLTNHMKLQMIINKPHKIVLPSQRARLQEIREFPVLYWSLTAICTLCLGIYITFMDDASDYYYKKKFQFKAIEAGKFITIPYIFSALYMSIYWLVY
ncbi:unnamed protein product [Paramecium sonneborni]|uniref:Transmembrane protein n=1 Tax=Paramecium sonneborni TaxID=65129 RepID=A0A8S1NP59_9CILI|nr:unnamed protein product [Paramecium sonneborni]